MKTDLNSAKYRKTCSWPSIPHVPPSAYCKTSPDMQTAMNHIRIVAIPHVFGSSFLSSTRTNLSSQPTRRIQLLLPRLYLPHRIPISILSRVPNKYIHPPPSPPVFLRDKVFFRQFKPFFLLRPLCCFSHIFPKYPAVHEYFARSLREVVCSP